MQQLCALAAEHKAHRPPVAALFVHKVQYIALTSTINNPALLPDQSPPMLLVPPFDNTFAW